MQSRKSCYCSLTNVFLCLAEQSERLNQNPLDSTGRLGILCGHLRMALLVVYVTYYQFDLTALAEGGRILATLSTFFKHRTEISINPYMKSSRSCLCLMIQLPWRTAEEHRNIMHIYTIMHLRSTALECSSLGDAWEDGSPCATY